MALASDLELDLLRLLVLLYARSCVPSLANAQISEFRSISTRFLQHCGGRECERTHGILATADLDELLDICDFGRHFGGMVELTID